MAVGQGLVYSHNIHGGEPITQRFVIPASNGTALFLGDVVELVNTTGAMDAAAEYQAITQFVSGHIPLGVVIGFKEDSSALLTGNYRAASTLRYVDVCVDPDAVYIAQEDAVGGAISAALVGAMTNANLVVAAGSTVTGQSGTMIDSNTTTASAADVKILGVPADGGNNYAAVSAGALLYCRLLGAAVNATDSQS